MVLSLCGAAFQPVVLEILQKVDGKFLIDAEITCGKHLTGNSVIFQNNNDPKHNTSAVKAYLDRGKTNKKNPKPDTQTQTAIVWPLQSLDLS